MKPEKLAVVKSESLQLADDAILVAATRREAELNEKRASLRTELDKLSTRLHELAEADKNDFKTRASAIAVAKKQALIALGLLDAQTMVRERFYTSRVTLTWCNKDDREESSVSFQVVPNAPSQEIAQLEATKDSLRINLKDVETQLYELPAYEKALRATLAEERLKSTKEGRKILGNIEKSPLLKQFEAPALPALPSTKRR